MNSEDMQRTIEFILDQQAQFATNTQLLRETQIQLTISQATAEVRTDRIEELLLNTVAVVERLAEIQAQTDAEIRELAGSQALTEASIRELAGSQALTEASIRELAGSQALTEASLRGLAEAQARLAGGQEHTDERLNTLINVVERYISKGNEGDSE